MKVSQLIKVLQELDPKYEVMYVQTDGIFAQIRSVQEVSYKTYGLETFVGLCCGPKVEPKDKFTANPVYISQKKQ